MLGHVLELWPDEGPVLVARDGLVLREWRASDVPVMVELFDTAEIDRWTPLPSPFDEAAASAYVERAHRARAEGTLQLAITEDGERPLGEVLVFPGGTERTVEIAYAVGADHRGRGLAVRSVLAVLDLAAAAGATMARATIAVDNPPGERVALAADFRRGDVPLVDRSRKGYRLTVATWVRSLTPPR
jgi:RimJ/RimL family protein N-acetyltransferase